jgi:hypothetical protein
VNIGQLKAELARYPDHWGVIVEMEDFDALGESEGHTDCPVSRVRNESNHIVLEID